MIDIEESLAAVLVFAWRTYRKKMWKEYLRNIVKDIEVCWNRQIKKEMFGEHVERAERAQLECWEFVACWGKICA